MTQNIDASNIELTKIVAKSIAQLAPSSFAYFELDDKRSLIMTCIFDLLNIDDDEIIHSALEALIEIIKVNFRYM